MKSGAVQLVDFEEKDFWIYRFESMGHPRVEFSRRVNRGFFWNDDVYLSLHDWRFDWMVLAFKRPGRKNMSEKLIGRLHPHYAASLSILKRIGLRKPVPKDYFGSSECGSYDPLHDEDQVEEFGFNPIAPRRFFCSYNPDSRLCVEFILDEGTENLVRCLRFYAFDPDRVSMNLVCDTDLAFEPKDEVLARDVIPSSWSPNGESVAFLGYSTIGVDRELAVFVVDIYDGSVRTIPLSEIDGSTVERIGYKLVLTPNSVVLRLGSTLKVCQLDGGGSAQVWSVATEHESSQVHAIAVHPFLNVIVSAGMRGDLHVSNLDELSSPHCRQSQGRERVASVHLDNPTVTVEFHPTGRFLATGGHHDPRLHICSTHEEIQSRAEEIKATEQLQAIIEGYKENFSTARVSYDERKYSLVVEYASVLFLEDIKPLLPKIAIRYLSLKGCTLENEDIDFLKEMPALERLDLRQIKGITGSFLGHLENHSRLASLALDGTSFDRNALAELMSLPRLNSIDIRRGQLASHELTRLRDAGIEVREF